MFCDCVHSSTVATVGGLSPPIDKAASEFPAPTLDFTAVARSATSAQLVPSQYSVVAK